MDQINDKIMKLILIGWLRVGVIERFFKESSLNRLWMYTCFPFVSKNWSPVQVESGPRWAKIIFVDVFNLWTQKYFATQSEDEQEKNAT